MANQWLRLWHDMPTEPKWRVIAKASKQPLCLVISLYTVLLVDASANSKDRGSIKGTDEEFAATLDCETEQVSAIKAAMQGRVLEGDRLTGWESRQPDREDGAVSGKSPGSNYIYYVATTDNDVIKVGISRNPWARVKDLQTGSDKKFTLLATMKTSARSEAKIHKFFDSTRANGEWFYRSSALNLLIEKTIAGDVSEVDECEALLVSLPEKCFERSVVATGSSVVTTKDKDTEESRQDLPPTSGEVADGAFPMAIDWQPSPHFRSMAKQSMLPAPGSEPFAYLLAEFVSFWIGQPERLRTQAEWDNALLKSLQANKVRGAAQPRPAKATKPASAGQKTAANVDEWLKSTGGEA